MRRWTRRSRRFNRQDFIERAKRFVAAVCGKLAAADAQRATCDGILKQALNGV